jgi:N utilization substance protein B
MASRRKGRILAFQALYAWECNKVPLENLLDFSWLEPPPSAQREGSPPAPPPSAQREGSPLEPPPSAQREGSPPVPPPSDRQATIDKGFADFSRLLIAGTLENIAAVDAMIKRHLQNWDFSRLNRVDLAILRMSVYTLMFQKDMAPSIVINEAIGISKEFGADDSYRFINGVLDSIRLTLQQS